MPPKKPKQKTDVSQDASAPEAEPQGEQEQQVIVPGANDWEPPKIFVKPRDQLELTEKQLSEELTRILRADNPQAPDNIARFSHKEKAFKLDPTVDQLSMHFSQDGHLLHVSSEDAKKQKDAENEEKEGLLAEVEKKKSEGAADASEDDARGLRNQFNFSERASQTLNNTLRERGTMTEPPPSVEYAAQCTQWEMFDAYMEDMERKREAEKKQKKGKGEEKKLEATGSEKKDSSDVIHSDAMAHAAKILERMVNQNTYDDITQDFKFWEDASDQYREGEGTLLPLWKFQNDKAKKKHVTAVKWNPEFGDLFAVGYGSYDFMKQGSGMLSLYSLKNPSFPEFFCSTDTGVMCVDWHPQHSSVLCVGLYDGTVCVYDVRSKKQVPIFHSTVKTGKHTDPVWEVCWQEEDLAKNLNFFSISSDGRVTLWTLSKSELEFSDVMQLKLHGKPSEAEAEEDSSLCGLAGGCCFDFSRLSEHLFLVGTEEGRIHKCSKAYNSQYLETYEGHYMAVYTVRWNNLNPKTFLSCSADWTVKLWDHTRRSPLMSFDLNTQVGDVAWTPWSSTTFAACTADGKLHVFDLNENKNEAMCEQKVVRKAKLTRLAFNPDPTVPVLLVGDDHAAVSCLKLSPNLRWTTITKAEAERKAKEDAEAQAGGGGPRRGAAPKKVESDEPKKDSKELEMEKMDKILEMALKNIID
jgi:dynein intermediate chain 1